MLLYPPIVRFDIHSCPLYIYQSLVSFFCLYIDLSVLGNLYRIIPESQLEVHYHFCIREISVEIMQAVSSPKHITAHISPLHITFSVYQYYIAPLHQENVQLYFGNFDFENRYFK